MNRVFGWSGPLLGVAAACLALVGCGGTATIRGTVTFNGQPVEKGAITFLPADGQGPVIGAPIHRGEYEISGALPGPRIVKIEAVKAVSFARSSEEMARLAAEAAARGDKTGLVEPADLVPADAEGNLTRVDVPAGTVRLDFPLRAPARPTP